MTDLGAAVSVPPGEGPAEGDARAAGPAGLLLLPTGEGRPPDRTVRTPG